MALRNMGRVEEGALEGSQLRVWGVVGGGLQDPQPWGWAEGSTLDRQPMLVGVGRLQPPCRERMRSAMFSLGRRHGEGCAQPV